MQPKSTILVDYKKQDPKKRTQIIISDDIDDRKKKDPVKCARITKSDNRDNKKQDPTKPTRIIKSDGHHDIKNKFDNVYINPISNYPVTCMRCKGPLKDFAGIIYDHNIVSRGCEIREMTVSPEESTQVCDKASYNRVHFAWSYRNNMY